MKIPIRHSCRGIALIIVMVSILVIATLAGGFAYSMKIETKLARNSNSEIELEWLARSGVEYARYCYAERLKKPGSVVDLSWPGILVPASDPVPGAASDQPLPNPNQIWELGNGKFQITKVTDLESRFNINSCLLPTHEKVLERALTLMGLGLGDTAPIVNSILDWMDSNQQRRLRGAEKDYYQGCDPPYFAKDGPIDDLSEMFLIRGVPEMCADLAVSGSSASGPPLNALTNFFAPYSMGKVNINTASAEVLQLTPGVDNNLAQAIVAAREVAYDPLGPGTAGPYRNLGELVRVTELPRGLLGLVQLYWDVRSYTYQIEIQAEVSGYRKNFVAVLDGATPNVPVLMFFAQ